MAKPERTKKSFFALPPIPTLLIVGATVVLMVYVFSQEEQNAISYVVYLLSVYALIVGISGSVRLMRRLGRAFDSSRLMKTVRGTEFGKRFVDDPMYRTELFLYQGFFINIVYVFIKLISGIAFRSVWFVALALYYLCLTTLRFSLLHYVRRTPVKSNLPAELRRYRLVGALLMLMDIALSIVVIMIVRDQRGYEYPGMLIYAMAAYTFYTVVIAIINVFKFRRMGSPVIAAAKNINFSAALVSMLSLETAMIAQFGGNDGESFRFIMTGVSGAVVCATVLGMASYMIIHATKRLEQEENNHE